MNCTLMHKRLAVATLELDEATGLIQKIHDVLAPAHLPVGISFRKGAADRAALNDWWANRSIPASRSGIQEVLETLDITNTRLLLVRCYGLSLSDQYWICPSGSGITWDQINFFDHPFSDDMGDVLFGRPKREPDFDFSSPDNTSDGFLKKRWKIIDGKRCLIKAGSNPFQQQPFNEAIAADIMRALEIPHVPYAVTWLDGRPYSVCEDFVTPDTELVSAWRVMRTQKKDNNVSVYQHFVNCCQSLGVPDVTPALDQMITLDYIIANEDRHLNNFGLIRNAETLEWLGMAPIFDSGSSLGYDKTAAQIRAEQDVVCKPFKKYHREQLKLVSSFAWVHWDALADADAILRRTLSEEAARELLGEDRIRAIRDAMVRRLQVVQEFSTVQRDDLTVRSTADDVEENIAEDYTPHLNM